MGERRTAPGIAVRQRELEGPFGLFASGAGALSPPTHAYSMGHVMNVVGLDEGVHQVVEPFCRDPVEEGDPAADLKAFRRCLGQFSTGVGVMTTVANDEPVGVTANSFSSLSMDPPLVLWSIARTSRSSEAFKNAKHFAVNILAVEQVECSQRFASPARDKFQGVDWLPGVLGSPILPNLLASLECALETTFQGGDHVILIGRVKKYSRYAGNALLYAQGRYAVAEDHPSLQLKPSGVAKGDAELNVSDMRLMALLAYVEMYASDAFDKYRQSQGAQHHAKPHSVRAKRRKPIVAGGDHRAIFFASRLLETRSIV